MASKKIRITNTTYLRTAGNPGFGLEFQGNYIGSNRQLVVELPVIPVLLEDWRDKGWIKIEDADAPLSNPGEAVVTPGTVVAEAQASKLPKNSAPEDMFEEEDFDLSVAKEASMPTQTAPISQGIGQMEQRPATVTLGSEHETVLAESVSPIPGDKPVSVDDSEKFTVRAPRSHAVGAVIKA